MKVFTVHSRRDGLDPERDIVLVKEGFSWLAFLFSILWALWCRLWLAALGILVAEVALSAAMLALGADPASQTAASIGLAVLIGLVGNDLKRWTLARRGFVDSDIVTGEDSDAAARRFFDRHPELAAG